MMRDRCAAEATRRSSAAGPCPAVQVSAERVSSVAWEVQMRRPHVLGTALITRNIRLVRRRMS